MNFTSAALVSYTRQSSTKRSESPPLILQCIYRGRIYRILMGSTEDFLRSSSLIYRSLTLVDRCVLKSCDILRKDPSDQDFSIAVSNMRWVVTAGYNAVSEVYNNKIYQMQFLEGVVENAKTYQREYLRQSRCSSLDEVKRKKVLLEIYRQAAWENDRKVNTQRKIDRDLAIFEFCPFIKHDEDFYDIIYNYWNAMGCAEWSILSNALTNEYTKIFNILNSQLQFVTPSLIHNYLIGNVSFEILKYRLFSIETIRKINSIERYNQSEAFERCALEYHFLQSSIMHSYLVMKQLREVGERFQNILNMSINTESENGFDSVSHLSKSMSVSNLASYLETSEQEEVDQALGVLESKDDRGISVSDLEQNRSQLAGFWIHKVR